jgi:hypothetical protein
MDQSHRLKWARHESLAGWQCVNHPFSHTLLSRQRHPTTKPNQTTPHREPAGRIVIECADEILPMTARNFALLCQGKVWYACVLGWGGYWLPASARLNFDDCASLTYCCVSFIQMIASLVSRLSLWNVTNKQK